jgi:hypothetical protein
MNQGDAGFGCGEEILKPLALDLRGIFLGLRASSLASSKFH